MEGGILGRVLLISRMVGVAPYLKGAEYRVSLPLVILAKLFILMSAVNFIITSTSSSNLFHQKYESLIAFDILAMTSKIFVVVTVFVSVFNSPERTIRVLRLVKQLDQIDKKILGDYVPYANETKLTVLIFLYLHVCLVVRGYYLHTGKIYETTLDLFFIITHYMITLSELQVGLFARRTMFSFNVINSSLEKLSKNPAIKDVSSQILKSRQIHPMLAWDKEKQQSFNIRSTQDSSLGRLVKTRLENIDEPVKLIRQCLKNYLHLSDVITASMDGDGMLIATLLLLNILHLLTHSYNLTLCAIASGPNFVKPNIYATIFWCVAYSMSVIIFIEPFHKTQSEIEKLQFILMSLKWMNLDEVDMNNELQLFGKIVKINNPKYSPLGMFTLNRSLVVAVFGGLVTYLVIMITYGPKLDNLKLITH